MSDLTRWFEGRKTPLDLIERLFEGDVASSAIKVEEVVDGDALVVRAELPGIDPEKDVDVSISGGELRINAHREEKLEYKERGSYRSEFRYGSLSRTLRLPEGATEGDVTATYKDGMLEVRVPLPPAAPGTGTKIEVRRG